MRFRRKKPKFRPPKKVYLVNHKIPFEEIRVIDAEGKNLGVLTKSDAIRKAYESDSDLVLVAEKTTPPVAKIVDFRKFLYEERREQKHSRKGGKKQEVKELRVGFNISDHDLQQRIKRAQEFLKERDKVKFTITFRGRTITRKQIGLDKIKRIIESLSKEGEVEKEAWWEGRRLIVLIRPR